MYKIYFLLVLVLFNVILCSKNLYSSSKIKYKAEIRLDSSSKIKKVDFVDLKNWKNEDFGIALELFIESCDRFSNFDEDKKIMPQISKKIIRKDIDGICKIARTIKSYESKYKKIFFEKFFIPYEVISNKSLFTGYYIPIIKAKKEKDLIYKYPIYKKPPELTSKKYYTRKQIHFGAISNRNLEIMYTNDPIELFFLHIQGSGIARVVDRDKTVYIGYDGKNNHKYSSLWDHVQKKGLLNKDTKRNAKSIKHVLRSSNKNVNDILNMNDSYVFFKIIKDNTIKGAFGTKLVPQRTMAIDIKYIPLGFLLWVETIHNLEHKNLSFNKIVLANDVGSAIKGAVRGDIFFGFGSKGEDSASFQHSSGKYFLLIPKKIARKL